MIIFRATEAPLEVKDNDICPYGRLNGYSLLLWISLWLFPPRKILRRGLAHFVSTTGQ